LIGTRQPTRKCHKDQRPPAGFVLAGVSFLLIYATVVVFLLYAVELRPFRTAVVQMVQIKLPFAEAHELMNYWTQRPRYRPPAPRTAER
jgi:hypothetical protein